MWVDMQVIMLLYAYAWIITATLYNIKYICIYI